MDVWPNNFGAFARYTFDSQVISFEIYILFSSTTFIHNIHRAENYLRVALVDLRAICLLLKSEYNKIGMGRQILA
jgi:hypothetical protein